MTSALDNYSLVIEKQAACLADVQLSIKEGRFGELLGSKGPPEIRNVMIHALTVGDPIYVEREIMTSLITPLIDTVPDNWRLTANILPTDSAFCWFGISPGSVPLISSFNSPAYDSPLVGLIWAQLHDGGSPVSLMLIPLTISKSGYAYPLGWVRWVYGQKLGDVQKVVKDKQKEDLERLTDEQHEMTISRLDPSSWWQIELRVFAALVEFMAQPIIAIRQMPPQRSVARRMKRHASLSPIKPIVVVALRRRVYRGKEGEGSTREYDHRFIVSSHWRNQWYPSEGVHRPRLIASYIKGPRDKELVVKRRFLAVVR